MNIQSNREGVVELIEGKTNILKSFVIKENLLRALKLLKLMNGVKTKEGVPIYETRKYAGVSVWAFHQHFIFWNFLREYVKYESVIKFLYEQEIKNVEISDNLRAIKNLLKIYKINFKQDKKSIWKRNIAKEFLTKSVAATVTFFAFLKLICFRARVLVYTPDKYSELGCDFRFAPIYSFLKKNNVDFVEVFHTLLNKEFYANLFKRKRVVLYLESLMFSSFLDDKFNIDEIDTSSIENYNLPYINYLLAEIDKRSQVSVRLIKVLNLLLKLTKVKKLVAIDDVRYANELIVACKLNNIKAYAIQHGQFTKYHVGWMNYGIPKNLSLTFDKLFVWNEYWKKVLLDYSFQYDEKNVEIGGWLRKLQPILYKKRGSEITDISQVNMLVPYEISVGGTSMAEEVRVYIKKFLDLDVHIFFSVRPDISSEKQLRQYGLDNNSRLTLVQEVNEEVLSQIDAVAGLYSTFLNEMMFYEKPVFAMKTSFDLGHRLTEDNLAVSLEADFKPEIIIDGINNFDSKRQIVWPETLGIEQTLEKLILSPTFKY
ncbi:hypothetical protein KJ641_03530 [Patescibacteria group bacterium]|nr:hypothetical protein [Patescibacteria group bacterium]